LAVYFQAKLVTKSYVPNKGIVMIKNYFKIAFRNLWKNKGFSAINILGLAIGITTCLIIMLFVYNELSYDRFNVKSSTIVRVTFQGSAAGEKFNEASIMPPVAQTMKADFPEVLDATRIRDYGKPRLMCGDKSFKDDAFAFVDTNFFEVFTLPLVEGNEKTALVEPNTVVITKALAHKYFGLEDPMGKVVSFKDGNNKTDYKVTGVINKVPLNSHFHFELFASMAGLAESKEPTWMSSNFYTYLVLKDRHDYKSLEAKLPGMVDKYIGPQMLQAMHVSLSDFRKKGNNLSFHLQRLTDIHLSTDFANDLSPAGDVRYVYIFGTIALFMLLIACINFMNLSTAGASKRSREVGIRKVLGSLKRDLIWQFLLESIMITAFACLLAIVFVYLALPVFNNLAGQNLTLQFADHPLLLPGLLLFLLVTGILAGSYPSFYLSSFKVATVLKSKFMLGKRSVGLRGGLVVFQFFISITLIVVTTMVYKQLSYIQHKKLGYDKEQVMIIPTWMLGKNAAVFSDQLSNDPRVLSVTHSGYLPAGPSDNNNFFVYPGENPDQMVKTLRYDVDENYISTLGIKLLTGRNFSKDFASDSSGVVINESAAKAFGWGENAPGHTISTSDHDGEKITYHVIGIVKDFHFRSLHELISPLVMTLSPNTGMVIVKLKTTDVSGLIAVLKARWIGLGTEEPFTYSFLDDRFNNTYQSEQKIGIILGIFAGLTIFVACLGLFGLAIFTAEQRTKEIGIRKVNGAKVWEVMTLLNQNFIRWILIATIIAAPIAWYAMNKWLENFAYKTTLSWWIFALAGLLALGIALLTVSWQSWRAATRNPVEALRCE
jgi:putative ABC transport system permease protein